MTTAKSVLGVLGMCWVDLGNPTHIAPSNSGRCGGVCWVCWVYAPARVRMRKKSLSLSWSNPPSGCVFSPRETLKNLTNPTHPTHIALKHCSVRVFSVFGVCWVERFCVGLSFERGNGR